MMHPNRRRKKRPNYGIRTIEIARGPSGFGFTISGQQPCILSCIVASSPAEQAGLRAGDFLISVNGHSVSKISHEAVVNLIGNSVGVIKMTIAENYYSDSSDEDNIGRLVGTRKPKHSNKPRIHRSKPDVFKKMLRSKENFNTNDQYAGACSMNAKCSVEGGPIEYKVIVGYLGTIEMPKQMLPNSRLQTVCNCIKKLRQEKRKPTGVLMTILPTCLTLKNSSNHILAIYPTNRVVYISSSVDKDMKYFGLVTSAVCDRSEEEMQLKHEACFINEWDTGKKCNVRKNEIEISNSCHVFLIDPKIIDHAIHHKKAESFGILCTNDPITGTCLEFPINSLYIVSLVQNMYGLQNSIEPQRMVEDLVANSPQPSASSNSDSGIGFRDDCGNVSDKILLVEFPINRPSFNIQNCSNNRPINVVAANILPESFDLPLNNVKARSIPNNGQNKSNLNNIRACENLSIKNVIEKNDYLLKQTNNSAEFSKLTCRALNVSNENQDPTVLFNERPINVPEDVMTYHEDQIDIKSSTENIPMPLSRHIEPELQGYAFKVPVLMKKRRNRSQKSVTRCLTATQFNNEMCLGKFQSESSVMSGIENFDVDKCGGSLQDLNTVAMDSHWKLSVTQSEPDVRNAGINVECEDNGNLKLSGERATLWAKSFEKLLECPIGLHVFSEFLKKEFSAENIYFWVACEKFRKLSSQAERSTEAQRIYQKHLKVGASEGVNVDSQARQCVEQGLNNVNSNLLVSVQKQIYNLMKFDSYSRFLKSDLYKQCLTGNYNPQQLDPNLLVQSGSKLKKSLSNAEDRRRKSLLPWHRKNRSKSKDREQTEYTTKKQDVNDNVSEPAIRSTDIHSSKSSLTSLDLAVSTISDISLLNRDRELHVKSQLCRVKLFNGSTSIVKIIGHESIKELITRLLEKRGLNYSSFEVFTEKNKKPLNINEPSKVLAGCEVEVERRISFRLDLPNNKVIAIKSKCSKLLHEVLRPVLRKYSYNLENVKVTADNGIVVDINLSVTNFDRAKLNVYLLFQEAAIDVVHKTELPTSFDELTNKVYEDILLEKSDSSTIKSQSDKESVKSEDWGSEHSGLIGRFLKTDSDRFRDKKKKIIIRSKSSSAFTSAEDITATGFQTGISCKKPLIAKLKPGAKLHNTSESEELYEGLSRAQRSRLEDQRGTEINFELPDFLKNKDNELSRNIKLNENSQDPKSYTNVEITSGPESYVQDNNLKPDPFAYERKIFFSKTNHAPIVYVVKESNDLKLEEDKASLEYATSKPPPLPPKPKILPIKPSNWKYKNVSKKDTYLEQSSSSFV